MTQITNYFAVPSDGYDPGAIQENLGTMVDGVQEQPYEDHGEDQAAAEEQERDAEEREQQEENNYANQMAEGY